MLRYSITPAISQPDEKGVLTLVINLLYRLRTTRKWPLRLDTSKMAAAFSSATRLAKLARPSEPRLPPWKPLQNMHLYR